MAWMPNSDRSRIANDGNSRLACNPDIVCIHTIVGTAPALAAHFSTRGDGHIWQHRDTTRQSAANLYGNNHIIAIENEDRGAYFPAWNINDGRAVPYFTAQQIESIAQICAWAHVAHGIPLQLVPNSRRGNRGIAYHRMGVPSSNNFRGFAYQGLVPGGEVWTTSPGKVCPGDRRISQIPQIIERAKQIVGGGGDDFLSALSPQEQRDLFNRVFAMLKQKWYAIVDGKAVQVNPGTPGATPTSVLDTLDGAYLVGKISDLDKKVSELEAKLDAKPEEK